MIFRVIGDNGYKLELIRPLRELPLRLGAVVDITVQEDVGDLRKLFDSQLDEDAQRRIIDQLRDSQKDEILSESKTD